MHRYSEVEPVVECLSLVLSPLLALLPSSTIHQHPSSDSSLNELPCGGLRLPECPPWRFQLFPSASWWPVAFP